MLKLGNAFLRVRDEVALASCLVSSSIHRLRGKAVNNYDIFVVGQVSAWACLHVKYKRLHGCCHLRVQKPY
ncbi:hypothetical protein HPB50_014833 [Hyalomma asiaticum]|uniref:Uncharacterized protein n=1 Tax=Hyalomma asiaticum TaxID=266040 RepID=A0ACB7SVL2_HYAAI|nr:hypothetical protein HPB50_014833 [Hyalomma asiaticum]